MYTKDHDKVAKIARKVIKKDFPQLKDVRINYIFRRKPAPGDDGMVIAGQVRILSSKMRDIYDVDVEMEIALPIWKALGKRGRYQLIWHELNHLVVTMNEETGEYEKDKEGRIIVGAQDHDLVMKTFSKELRKFGLTARDLKMLKTLYEIYRDWKSGKIKERKTHLLGEEEIDFG